MVTCCYCYSLYHSLSFVVIRCHSLSFVVPLVVLRCTTRCHLLYQSLSFVVTRCHSLSLVVTRFTTRLSFYERSIFRVVKLWRVLILCVQNVFISLQHVLENVYCYCVDLILYLFISHV